MAAVNSLPLGLLSREVRHNIFRHAVFFEPGAKCPALLVAFVSEEYLLDEAKYLLRTTNYVVTARNQDGFVHMKMGEFMRIRHLTMVREGDDLTSHSDWLNLRSSKCYLFNFEAITVDLRGEYTSSKKSKAFADHELEYMVRASLPGVNRIVFVLNRTRPFWKRNNAIRKQMKDSGFRDAARVDGQRWAPDK
ncbi:hypothetical protein BDZ45DRAFT_746892 [Acephala macrosclerotiorum]|nr:hypothetical protein BDZ45DRAFT_746892 [Acephala macrosclerotiorum]